MKLSWKKIMFYCTWFILYCINHYHQHNIKPWFSKIFIHTLIPLLEELESYFWFFNGCWSIWKSYYICLLYETRCIITESLKTVWKILWFYNYYFSNHQDFSIFIFNLRVTRVYLLFILNTLTFLLIDLCCSYSP